MSIWLSRNLAIVIGILAPLLETVRRWHTWRDDPASFFDDYILGGLLLYGAWRVTKDEHSGQKFLTGAWGFALGMAYVSFFFQLHQLQLGIADPAPISSEWVAVIKGIGFVLVISGFIASLRKVSVKE